VRAALFAAACLWPASAACAPGDVTPGPLTLGDTQTRDAVRETVRTRPQSPPSGASKGGSDYEIVKLVDGPAPAVHVRYRVDWIELADQLPLDSPPATSDPTLLKHEPEVRSRVSWELLRTPILTRAEIATILQSCDAGLEIVAPPPRPPFYRSAPSIKWNRRQDLLFLKAVAVVDEAGDRCARATVNLRTGESICSPDVPCGTEQAPRAR
jgi:hypothetical protein